MAPTVTIETITIVRPLKVISFVCGIITALLMLLALASSSWLQTVGWRQGLFEHCIKEDAPEPLPFEIDEAPGCHPARDEPYILGSAILCIVCLLLDIIATVLTGFGLNCENLTSKYKYYRNAVWVMTLSLISILIALILYPVYFAQELNLGAGNREVWEFGWAYGVGWGAAIFLFGAIVLLLCDQEEEEIYYKERTIIHAENDSRA